MKILVTGDREWDDIEQIAHTLERILETFQCAPRDVTIVHGAARGADTIAGLVAEELGMEVKSYPAHWRHTDRCPKECKEVIGRPAGVIRNQKMLNDNPDIDFGIFFHPDLARSKGTKDMVKRLKKAGIPILSGTTPVLWSEIE